MALRYCGAPRVNSVVCAEYGLHYLGKIASGSVAVKWAAGVVSRSKEN